MHVNDPEGTMHGLGLDNKMLDKIYSENFLHFSFLCRKYCKL